AHLRDQDTSNLLDICANNNKTRELVEDLLSIVIVFVAQHNGLCCAANHKRRKETTQANQKFQEDSNKTSSKQGNGHKQLGEHTIDALSWSKKKVLNEKRRIYRLN
ncbi:24284_t:CDS:2, partial [Racocetra persica]